MEKTTKYEKEKRSKRKEGTGRKVKNMETRLKGLVNKIKEDQDELDIKMTGSKASVSK